MAAVRLWLLWLLLASFMQACQLTSEHDGNLDPDNSKHQIQSKGAASPGSTIQGMTHEETELKLAKLWSRVDELETRLIRQQEKVRLLERGFMLGVIPEGLKADNFNQPESLEQKSWDEADLPQPAKESDKKTEVSPLPVDSRSYEQLLSEAQAKFNAGRYGQAIADYQAIHQRFPEQTKQGQHLYWIGLSWYYLKEDDLASENLSLLISQFPGSAWLPQANFYLAKVELRRGLRQKALQRLRTVVELYGDKDVAEMARHELSQLQESL